MSNNCILLIRIAFYQELDKSSLFIHILDFKAIADISMCVKDKECPMKFSCYRHTAPWNPFRQSILAESPREEGSFYCPEFWDNKGRTLDQKFKEYEQGN